MGKLTADQFIGYCWEVVEWNKVSRGGKHTFSPEEGLKQLDYCLEEIQETLEAYEEVNLVGVLDGLADCLVTLSYLIALAREEDVLSFDVIEGSRIPNNSNNFYLRLANSYQRLSTDFPLVTDAEIALLDVIGALNSINDQWNEDVDVVGVIEEVLDSNWSKFPYLDQVIPAEECKWIEEHRGKEGVTYSVIGDRVVFRDGGGKIMKPSTFKEPDIQRCIYKVEEEVKLGSIVQCVGRGTSLTMGACYEVEDILEDLSVIYGDVVYGVRCLGTDDNFCVQDSWLKGNLVIVLEGDEDDYDKIDVSDQVAELRERIEI